MPLASLIPVPIQLRIASTRSRLSRWFAGATYVEKWLVLGILIGIIAGLGAVVFYAALTTASTFLFEYVAGYTLPSPIGEGFRTASSGYLRPYLVPAIVGFGGLISAILVFNFAPEAEGHGTDAAISAVHHNPKSIRIRAVLIKIIASAITIGSGGSGGREGPTGQISAGFGSFLARIFDLNPTDSRIAVASGVGSGIGAIFGAPLGGAVLATEIMYRDDFEVEALLPSFIASTVAYLVFGLFEGYGPLFGNTVSYHLVHPTQLVWFAIIGLVSGGIGLLYARGFYGIAHRFSHSRIPQVLRPMIGGIIVGCIALVVPQVIGTGYGWIQVSLSRSLAAMPLWLICVIPLARILATGLSIGSGGSGGIFGPGMVIGAFVGAAVWKITQPILPGTALDPAPYVIVGMMACFGSISRAPLAVMLMVAEMTGTLSLIFPAMVAVGLATLIIRRSDATIYQSQLRSRDDSPAHQLIAGMPLLASLTAAQVMAKPRLILRTSDTVEDAARLFESSGLNGAPVISKDERYVGGLDAHVLAGKTVKAGTIIEQVMDEALAPAMLETRGSILLEMLINTQQPWIPIVDGERRIRGIVSSSDLVRGYRYTLLRSLRRVSYTGNPDNVLEVPLAQGSPLVHLPLRTAPLPLGVLITQVERGKETFIPTGDTVLLPNDRITALGSKDRLAAVRTLLAAATPSDPETPRQPKGVTPASPKGEEKDAQQNVRS